MRCERPLAFVLGAMLGAASCGGDGANDATRVRGDTTILSHEREGRWGKARAATELLRVVPQRPEEELAEVTDLAALPAGGVIVFDARGAAGPALREFDARGRYVRTLGRHGRGPGEYGSTFVSLAVTASGEVLLHDRGRGRVLRYRDGVSMGEIPLPERLVSGLSGTTLVPMPDGSIMLAGPLSEKRRLGRPFFLRVDSLGHLSDSLIVSDRWLGEVPEEAYDLGEDVIPLRNGGFAVWRTDRLGFVRREPGSRDVRLVEVRADRPWHRPEERAELQRIEQWSASGGRAPRSPRTVPERKQLVRGAFEDLDGRIWLERSGEAVRIPPRTKYWDRRGEVKVSWADSLHLAGFAPDGAFLGEVTFPPFARVGIVGGHAWAIVPGADDIPTLVKYRIANP